MGAGATLGNYLSHSARRQPAGGRGPHHSDPTATRTARLQATRTGIRPVGNDLFNFNRSEDLACSRK
jgi:hypothetical protein